MSVAQAEKGNVNLSLINIELSQVKDLSEDISCTWGALGDHAKYLLIYKKTQKNSRFFGLKHTILGAK